VATVKALPSVLRVRRSAPHTPDARSKVHWQVAGAPALLRPHQLGAQTPEFGASLIDPAFFSRSSFSISSAAPKPPSMRETRTQSVDIRHDCIARVCSASRTVRVIHR
jgi:hypothetical protein